MVARPGSKLSDIPQYMMFKNIVCDIIGGKLLLAVRSLLKLRRVVVN
ncbi:hypothetical protein CCACVL1_06481 [Corchorus capsularis]|uniref:Uncharacterized protein n=1 Tax=Corchorus capsularis TaxID=210143 RepID=A0A1R3JFD8_COCAP|nr:hypothetical protein CCACVL1_06481 [Corchorus capsularis]